MKSLTFGLLVSIFAFADETAKVVRHNPVFLGTAPNSSNASRTVAQPVKNHKPTFTSICMEKTEDGTQGVYGRGPNGKPMRISLEKNGTLSSKEGEVTLQMTQEMTELYASKFTDPKFQKFQPIRSFLNRQLRGKRVSIEMFVVTNPATCPHCVDYEPVVNKLASRGLPVNLLTPAQGRSTLKYQGGIPYTEIRTKSGQTIFKRPGAQSQATMDGIVGQYMGDVPKTLDEAVALFPKTDKKLIPCSETPVSASNMVCDPITGTCRLVPGGEKQENANPLRGLFDGITPTIDK